MHGVSTRDRPGSEIRLTPDVHPPARYLVKELPVDATLFRMIRPRVLLFLAAGVLLARTSWAQDDIQALEAALKDKPMTLRSFSADPVARYTWTDGKLIAQPSEFHSFGAFATQSVKLEQNAIVLEGQRATLVRDDKNKQLALVVSVPMKLEIDLQGADPTTVLPNLQQLLFYPDLKTAVLGLPIGVGEYLLRNLLAVPKSNASSNGERIFDGGSWVQITLPNPAYKRVKLVTSVEPEVTTEARRKKVSGSVRIMFFVPPTTGRPEDIWLIVPFGLGMDENAERAVQQYVFKPAQYNGRPVGTELMLQVSFTVY
jgi:Gram-negative bacterial TonB protein C-terminal